MLASEFLPVRFNVAAHFVDRNVDEGRAEATAFLCADRNLTYGDVLELVEPDRQRPSRPRGGDGRPRPDGLPGRPRVRGNVLGRDQDRGGAGSGQHPAAPAGLRLSPERQPLVRRGGVGGPPARGRAGPRGGSPPAPRAGGRGPGPRLRVLGPARRACLGRARGRPHLAGRRSVLALLFGIDRLPERRRAPSPRHGDLPGDLREAGPRHRFPRTASTRRPSSSSPTALATRSTSPWEWGRRACSSRSGRPPSPRSR